MSIDKEMTFKGVQIFGNWMLFYRVFCEDSERIAVATGQDNRPIVFDTEQDAKNHLNSPGINWMESGGIKPR